MKLLFVFIATLWFAAGYLAAQGGVVFTFAGEIMAHDVNYRMADYDAIYRDVRAYLKEDDLSFVNFEFPVDDTLPYATFPSFNVQIPYARAALRGGFDVVSLANNHTNDMGIRGMLGTLASMKVLSREFRFLYDGVRADPARPFDLAVRVVNGVKVGFISATNLLNQNVGKPHIRFVGWRDHWTGVIDTARLEAFLGEVRSAAAKVDLLVVSLHDGVEYAAAPLESQRLFYQQVREAGARVVWVHHPHVLQPWQRVGEGLILYSMGNFISGQRHMLGPSQWDEYRAERGDGALVRVRFVRGPEGLWRMSEPQTQFVTHFREPRVGWVVKRLPALLETLPDQDPWKDYYTRRYHEMRKRFVPLGPIWTWSDLYGLGRAPPSAAFYSLL